MFYFLATHHLDFWLSYILETIFITYLLELKTIDYFLFILLFFFSILFLFLDLELGNSMTLQITVTNCHKRISKISE